jgi:hypothetical protein
MSSPARARFLHQPTNVQDVELIGLPRTTATPGLAANTPFVGTETVEISLADDWRSRHSAAPCAVYRLFASCRPRSH